MDLTRKVRQDRRRQKKRQRRAYRKQRSQRRRPRPDYRKTFLDCQRHFLTPLFWRVAHAAAKPFGGYRWKLMPLVMVAILMLFMTSRSAGERFEEARQYWTCMAPGRRRVGKTVEGFLAALERLPRRVLKAMSKHLRGRVEQVLGPCWEVDGWKPFGVDGSRLDLPRYTELERRFGNAGTEGAAPQLWVTTLVHLGTGVLWSWRLGRSNASEQHHFRRLLQTLPEKGLAVTDAGFCGYDTWREVMKAKRHFLIRLSGGFQLYADFTVQPDFQQGIVYMWPARQPRKRPLRLRLIRLPGKEGRKHDVWLVTNVMDPNRLSVETASKLFRMRWEQEVFYRSYKRTLANVKLSSRTPRQAIREAELALLATQLFLAQSSWAVHRSGSTRRASAAEAARQIRRELRDLLRGRLRLGYLKRLAKAVREHRPNRTSSKEHRYWPGKKHNPPGPPKIITMTVEQKQQLQQQLKAA